jgi:hypothetical protein
MGASRNAHTWMRPSSAILDDPHRGDTSGSQTELNQTHPRRYWYGSDTLFRYPTSRLLRCARNDVVSGCHCEERSDEAISILWPATGTICPVRTTSAQAHSDGAVSLHSSCPALCRLVPGIRGNRQSLRRFSWMTATSPRLSGSRKAVVQSPADRNRRLSCPCLSRVSTSSAAEAGSVDGRNWFGHDDLWLHRRYVHIVFPLHEAKPDSRGTSPAMTVCLKSCVCV